MIHHIKPVLTINPGINHGFHGSKPVLTMGFPFITINFEVHYRWVPDTCQPNLSAPLKLLWKT